MEIRISSLRLASTRNTASSQASTLRARGRCVDLVDTRMQMTRYSSVFGMVYYLATRVTLPHPEGLDIIHR